MTEKWGEISSKKIGLSLVRVSGEFELSGFYCKIIILIILITGCFKSSFRFFLHLNFTDY